MTEAQRAALAELEPWLLEWLECIWSSHVIRYPPHANYGKVEDEDALAEIAAIEAFCEAFEIERPKLSLEKGAGK